MLKYQLETEINKPLDEVIRLFADRSLLCKWQPGLLSSEQIESYPHPKYKLVLAFGRRNMPMTETILRNQLPDHFEGTYEMKGVYNRINHSFTSISPEVTRWTCINEFRFSGVMTIVAFFMRDNFRQQSIVIMSNFKKLAEHMLR